jgi:hypothetical protein
VLCVVADVVPKIKQVRARHVHASAVVLEASEMGGVAQLLVEPAVDVAQIVHEHRRGVAVLSLSLLLQESDRALTRRTEQIPGKLPLAEQKRLEPC